MKNIEHGQVAQRHRLVSVSMYTNGLRSLSISCCSFALSCRQGGFFDDMFLLMVSKCIILY